MKIEVGSWKIDDKDQLFVLTGQFQYLKLACTKSTLLTGQTIKMESAQ